ncbi:hydrogenase small subunit [Thiocystis minor]|uniref:hydrogenase small subunit n=1 Tax=Thiocystis minor TaxID=61597 RepID=UPI00191346BD|nr:hydrogenase small subunit [Thiocystis minor]
MSVLDPFETRLSRRGFLKWCGYLASSLALPASLIPQIAAGLERTPRLPVIWLSFQSCSGCAESLTRSATPTLESLILDFVSLDFHPLLQASAGTAAERSCQASIKSNFGRYLLIVEGAIPIHAHGAYATCAGQSGLKQLAEATEGAAAIIAVGSCAAFGGIPQAHPNPTGAHSVHELMVAGRIPQRPLVNLPGCPPLPIAMAATLAHIVVFGAFPRLDARKRPVVFYGQTIHDHCSRLSCFQQGLFAERFDDLGARNGWCLFKLGCKGPATHNACSLHKWNDGLSFPVESGHPCLGCSEPGAWDRDGLYHPIKVNLAMHNRSP